MGIEFRSDMTVELVDSMGDDTSVVRAARVSTSGSSPSGSYQTTNAGLINYLMKNRHGSPFEHGAMSFRIEAPIFVTRELRTHRIGFSHNETSGRYRELDGVFYTPYYERPLVQQGNPGSYQFVSGSDAQQDNVQMNLTTISIAAHNAYQEMLELGIAREVARMVLPVNTYSSMYITCNPRSIMAFLSLRVDWGSKAACRSHPMREIEMVALKMDEFFRRKFPLTHQAFVANGYAGP